MSPYQQINHATHNSKLRPVALLLVTIGTDQYTKFLAEKLFDASTNASFLNSFLEFSFIRNHDGFLGIVNNLSEIHKFFLLYICVSILLLASLIYIFCLKKRTARYTIPLVFVTGGGLSNLLDRILHNGGVTDFLSIGLGNLRTGIFNLADIYIFFGSFFFGYLLFVSAPKTAH